MKILLIGLGCLIFASNVLSFQPENILVDDSVGAMTTLEPIDTYEDRTNCAIHQSCEECLRQNCTWIRCPSEEVCDKTPDELCPPISQCGKDTTTTQQPTTTDTPATNQTTDPTTDQPTTSAPVTNQTTTDAPTTTNSSTTNQPPTTDPVTSQPTTTAAPTDLPTTKQPDTTVEPVTDTTTLSTTTSTSTTTALPAHPGHFDAASFVGGIILCVSLTAVAYAGYKFYLRRSLAPSYSNF